MKNPLSQHIIRQLQRGDVDAYTYVYNQLHKRLFVFALRLLGDAQEAEDIVQESFIKLFHQREKFSTVKNIEAYLLIAIRNACFNFLHANHRQQESIKEITYISEEEAGDTALAEEEWTKLREAMAKGIQRLPERCRQVITLLFYEGLSPIEIAIRLDIDKQTVSRHKTRGLELLRKYLIKKNCAIR